MEPLIYAILKALNADIELSLIHDTLIEAGHSEDDFFLAFKAAENLKAGIEYTMANKLKALVRRSNQ